MSRYRVTRVDGIGPIDVAGVHWRPVRRELGITAFGMNAYSADAGEDVVEPHTEEKGGHEEAYLVLAGRAAFTLDGDEQDAPAGTIVFVSDPSVRRHARAVEDGTLVLAVGAKPGEAYTPSAWEEYFAVERHRPTGDHAAAIAELQEAFEHHPANAGVVYSLACWHALAGDDEDALRLARFALELDPTIARHAWGDDDLASIRDPLFPDGQPATG